MKRVILTVGMIVKNEEKYLEGCLERLKPLLDAIPSELIIADTGSTDRTVEIAKKYTDKVFHFDWVNDFAAARNATLDRATGEWYMFIDADEWLESVEQMIGFFRKKQKVDFAVYYRRDIMLREGKETFGNFTPPRIFRRTPQLRFLGKIHERIPVSGDYLLLKDVAMHYGYYTPEQAMQKTDRNLPILLDELKENPNDLHVIYQIQQEYSIRRDFKAAIAYCQRALALIDWTRPSNPTEHGVFRSYMILLSVIDADQPLLEEAERYFAQKKQIDMSDLDVYFCMTKAAQRVEDMRAVAVYAGKYFKLLDDIQAQRINATDLINGPLKFDSPFHQRMLAIGWVLALAQLSDWESLSRAAKRLGGVAPSAEEEERQLLMCLLAVELFRCKRLGAVTAGIDPEDIKPYLQALRAAVPDYAAMVRRYYLAAPPAEASGELYWEICLCELALLGAGEEERGGYRPLFERYCRSLGLFVFHIYSEAVLTEEEIGMLPRVYRFGFYAMQAFGALDAGDRSAFLRLLVEAGRQYPVMLEYIRAILAAGR